MNLDRRLFLLVLMPMIPALVLACRSYLELRRLTALDVESDAVQAVRVGVANQRTLLDATRQNLALLAGRPEALETNVAGFDRFFATLPTPDANYADFGLLETDGTLVSSSFRRADPTNHSGLPHFERVLKTARFAVGGFQPGTEVRAGGLVCAHPVTDANGRVVRVLYATLKQSVLIRVASNTVLPDGGMLTLLDREGNVLAAAPQPDRWVGTNLLDSRFFRTVLSRETGTVEGPGPDRVTHLTAFAPVDTGPEPGLLLAVGTPLATAFAAGRRTLARNLAVLFAVGLATFLIARRYARMTIVEPIHRLVDATKRLESGDLATRAGLRRIPSELDPLVRAFDSMAANLERHRTDTERAAEALRESEERLRQLNASLEQRVRDRTAQLEEVNRELEAFSYSVSHDLRAPLRHMDGFVRMLQHDATSNLSESGRRYLEVVSGSAKRMGGLIDDLLLFSRMGRQELVRTRIDMARLAEEARQEVSSDLAGRTVEWRIEPLPEVMGDPSLLRQVWVNLFSNAVKYTRNRDPATIEVQARSLEGAVEFSVRDNGAGFDMRYVDKLFGVFQRLHRAEDFEGTGIGLANVRRVIVRHGGSVRAEGRPDAGATFHFTLPSPEGRVPRDRPGDGATG